MPSRLELRIREPVALCLMKRLIVPNVYYDVQWPDTEGSNVDVLVIDRGGKGDVHVVMVREHSHEILEVATELLTIPGHFRWVAYHVQSAGDAANLSLENGSTLDPQDRMGRIGVIEVSSEPGDILSAEILVKAERFKGSYYDLADRFTEREPADYEVR